MHRRSFFATLFGGIVAALWPAPQGPIICEALPKIEPVKLFFRYRDSDGSIHRWSDEKGWEVSALGLNDLAYRK